MKENHPLNTPPPKQKQNKYQKLKRKIHSLKLHPLPCNGTLCPWKLNFVHPTCLICRPRRQTFTNYRDPPIFIHYTYKNSIKQQGDGNTAYGVLIDPRGHFTHLRLSTIQVIDQLMTPIFWRPSADGRPLTEICEFLANYPI